MSEINPNNAITFIIRHSELFAKAKAERVYLEQYRKSKKAILFAKSEAKTMAEREAEAYAHPEYIELLKGLQEAVEIEETLRFKIEAAKLRVEVYRTMEASNRRIDNATR